MKITIVLVSAIFILTTSTFAQSSDEKAKKDIRAVMDKQVADWNAGNIEGFMQGYWNSPELTFVSGTNITKGWQETLGRYKNGYDTREKMGFLAFADLEVRILSKKSAVVLGKWALKREKDNPNGLFTLTFMKFKQGWRIILDRTS